MFEFHKPDRFLTKMLGPQKLKKQEDYRFSAYVLYVESSGKRYAYSTLTKQGLELPAGLDTSRRFRAEEIESDPDLFTLMEGCFLVPAERDETAFYENLAAAARVFQTKRGLTSFVVLPTMACNARCVYCYEEGSVPSSMTRETEEALVDYLDRVRQPDTRLFLQWFGGEPLLGAQTVDRVLSGLRERGIDYLCGFTTNGSLIDASIADKMAGIWNTRSVQITLDGAEDTYLRRKRYCAMPDAYRRVLENIGLLTDRGIPVTVRINLDGENAGELPAVLADLSAAVRAKDKVSVYLAPLYQLRMSEKCLSVWSLAESLFPLLRESGFHAQRMIAPSKHFYAFRCMAADPSANMLITPEGRLSPCQHQLAGPLYGSVREGITEKEAYKAATTTGPTPEKCRGCRFLPDCTSYSLCPVFDYHCVEARTMIADSVLREMIEKALQHGPEEEHEIGDEPEAFPIPPE